MQKKNNYTKLLATCLCLAELLVFIIFYIITYLPSVGILKVGDFVYFPLYYLSRLVEFCLPIAASAAVFGLCRGGFKEYLIKAALFSLPRAVYLIPYYYLYENSLGNNSLESLGFSLLITIGGILLLFLHISLLLLVMRTVFRFLITRGLKKSDQFLAKKENSGRLKAAVVQRLPEETEKFGPFDLTLPVNAALFSAAILEFLYPLTNEIVSTVKFFIAYGSGYTPWEIFSICFAFIFVLIELLAAYGLGILLKHLSVRFGKKSQSDTQETK